MPPHLNGLTGHMLYAKRTLCAHTTMRLDVSVQDTRSGECNPLGEEDQMGRDTNPTEEAALTQCKFGSPEGFALAEDLECKVRLT
jgi:hypothetical protein